MPNVTTPPSDAAPSDIDRGPWPPCPAPFNLAAHVLAAGRTMPDRIALAVIRPTGAERWSYARLTAAVRGTATGLREAGLHPGDRVLLRLGDSVDFPIAYLGAIAAGLVPVPTSAQLTARELAPMVALLRPAAILHDGRTICPESPAPVFDTATLKHWRTLAPAAWHAGDPDRPAYVVFTSGTSGRPRAVVHAHRAIWARGMMTRGWYDLRPTDRVLHAGAFNWTFTLGTGLMDPWTAGATALIPAHGTEAAQLPLLLGRFEATLFAAAPGIFRRLLRMPIPALPALRHGLSAGEKLAEPLRTAWHAATGTALHEAYGMSECSTFISAAPDAPAADGCIGAPQPGRRVALLDAAGVPVPQGTAGTIAVHHSDPGLMLGYLREDQACHLPLTGDWFVTGDRAALRADGQIAYHGRCDDMMNAGGYRVSPLEVEAALADLPGIEDIAVTDIAVKQNVRVIAAFYTAGAPLDEAALDRLAAQRLARYKQPRAWIRLDALPRGANGKLARSALRDHAPSPLRDHAPSPLRDHAP